MRIARRERHGEPDDRAAQAGIGKIIMRDDRPSAPAPTGHCWLIDSPFSTVKVPASSLPSSRSGLAAESAPKRTPPAANGLLPVANGAVCQAWTGSAREERGEWRSYRRCQQSKAAVACQSAACAGEKDPPAFQARSLPREGLPPRKMAGDEAHDRIGSSAWVCASGTMAGRGQPVSRSRECSVRQGSGPRSRHSACGSSISSGDSAKRRRRASAVIHLESSQGRSLFVPAGPDARLRFGRAAPPHRDVTNQAPLHVLCCPGSMAKHPCPSVRRPLSTNRQSLQHQVPAARRGAWQAISASLTRMHGIGVACLRCTRRGSEQSSITAIQCRDDLQISG